MIVARFGRIDRSNLGPISFGVVGPKRCAVAKVCLVLSGQSRPRWKKAGKTIR
jgi:hypothetical protein